MIKKLLNFFKKKLKTTYNSLTEKPSKANRYEIERVSN